MKSKLVRFYFLSLDSCPLAPSILVIEQPSNISFIMVAFTLVLLVLAEIDKETVWYFIS